MKSKSIGVVGALAGVIALAGGCSTQNSALTTTSTSSTMLPTTTTTTPPLPTAASLGTAAELVAADHSVVGTVNVTAVDITTQPGNPYGQGPQNGYYAIVHAAFVCNQSYASGFEASPAYFYILINGQHFGLSDGNAIYALPVSESEMSTVTLAAGESTSGVIPFDISAAHGTVVYAPNFGGQPVAEWSF